MDYNSNLRSLKSKLEQKVIDKENYLLLLNKEANSLKLQKEGLSYGSLEREYDSELIKASSMEKAKDYIKKLAHEWELKEQLDHKEETKEYQKAEDLLQSLTLKVMDENDRKTEKANRKSKIDEDLNRYWETQVHVKDLEKEKEAAEKAFVDCTAEQENLLHSLRKECELLRKRRKDLERNLLQVGLLSTLEETISNKEELVYLRKEEECWKKEQEEAAILKKREDEDRERARSILEERDTQLILKEEIKKAEKEREETYIKLLVELLGEEERLERLQTEVRRRKQMEHRVVAQMILEERRKRKQRLLEENEQALMEEQAVENLRLSVLREEERRLILRYLPHLGPFLSSQVLDKLSSL